MIKTYVIDDDITSFHDAIRNKLSLSSSTAIQWPAGTFSYLNEIGTVSTTADLAIAGHLTSLSIPSYTHSTLDLAGLLFGNKDALQNIYISTISEVTEFPIDDYAFSACGNITEIKLPTATFLGTRWIGEGLNIVEDLSFPKVTQVGDEAFYNYVGKTEGYVSLPECIKVGTRGFYNASSIRVLTMPKVETIGPYAFYSCSRVRTFNMPLLTEVPEYAFANTIQMVTGNFQAVTTIGQYGFSYAQAWSTQSFPELLNAGRGAFDRNYAMTAANFPKLTSIAQEMFSRCSKIMTISCPEVSEIGSLAFWMCSMSHLDATMMPKLKKVNTGAFSKCISLIYAEFGSQMSYLQGNAFMWCSVLTYISLKARSCTLSVNSWESMPFESCPALVSIYVPMIALEDYKVADNWSLVSDKLVGWED